MQIPPAYGMGKNAHEYSLGFIIRDLIGYQPPEEFRLQVGSIELRFGQVRLHPICLDLSNVVPF